MLTVTIFSLRKITILKKLKHSYISKGIESFFGIVIPLTIGTTIYVFFCTSEKWIFQIIPKTSILEFINTPSWLVHNVPDGLWAFSLTYFILMIWNSKINLYSMIFVFSSILLGTLVEFLQHFDVLKGTYDPLDLLFLTVFGITAVILNQLINRENRQNEK